MPRVGEETAGRLPALRKRGVPRLWDSARSGALSSARSAITARDSLVLAAGALVVRAAWVIHTPGYRPQRDGYDYMLLANSLVGGHGYQIFGQPTAFRPPGYAGLLASWFELIGVPQDDWSGVRLMQAAICPAAVVLIPVIASEL